MPQGFNRRRGVPGVCIYIYGICGGKIVPTCRLKQAEICAVCWMSTLSARELVCAKGWRDVSLSPSHSTMYFIFLHICKSNCCVTDYFMAGFCHILPALQL